MAQARNLPLGCQPRFAIHEKITQRKIAGLSFFYYQPDKSFFAGPKTVFFDECFQSVFKRH